MNKNTKLIVTALTAFFITLLFPACGPLTPHVDVNANVNGSVNTSGIVSVNVDATSLENFFTTQCENELGSTATQAQIQACASAETTAFFNMVGVPAPSPSPSPSPT